MHNNAAFVTWSDIESTDPDYFRKVLDVNLVAPLSLIQAALPDLKANKGSIVNIGSVNAHCGEPTLLAYSASKGALTTLTRNLGDSLMQEYGVRVNQVNPGWVLTENEAARKQEHGLKEDWYKDLALVNLVTDTRVIPEFIGKNCRADLIAPALVATLNAPQGQLGALRNTMDKLGRGATSPGTQAARSVIRFLNRA